MINELVNSGALPSLELTLRFAGERQRLIAHNIANLSTPDFRQADVAPAEFAQALRDAVDRRRAATGGETGRLGLRSTRQIRFDADGGIELRPRTTSGSTGNILFHDRNNRDLERLMQDNAENVAVHRLSADLLRSRYEILRAAIAERV